MEGFNPHVKVSAEGETRLAFPEQEERLASPSEQMEAKLLALSETERAELLQDALEQYSDLETLIHAITRMEGETQPTLF